MNQVGEQEKRWKDNCAFFAQEGGNHGESSPQIIPAAFLQMQTQGHQAEKGGQNVSPSHQTGHALGLDRVGGEEQGTQESQVPTAADQAAEDIEQQGRGGVEEDIAQMVESGGGSRMQVVQSKREYRERTV